MENAFDNINNVDDLFKELDQSGFNDIAEALSAYRKRLMKEGFTRREAMKLVEAHSRFLYDLFMEDVMADKRKEEFDRIDSLDEDPIDPDDFEP